MSENHLNSENGESLLTSNGDGDSYHQVKGENIINANREYGATSSSSDSITNIQSSSVEGRDEMRSTLSFFQKIGFGLGHIYNDLCAGVWFSYTLLFMQATLKIPAPETGALVMLGQISDALSTPIVGLIADRYGTKRKWHIFGTSLVSVSFPMIFSLCPWCPTAPHWWPPIYFAFFIIVFQFAWAMVQITHLAMIPEISKTLKDRADLTATRYSASVCSNVIVYIVTWALLQGHDKFDKNIGPNDAYRFRDISLILTLIGLTMSVLFQFSLTLTGYERRRMLALAHQTQTSSSDEQNEHEEKNHQNYNSTSVEDGGGGPSTASQHEDQDATTPSELDSLINYRRLPRNRKNFLASPLLYINALLYVFSRLFMTTSLVYMPLWLDERSWQSVLNAQTLESDISVDHLATVPLVSFLASFIASLGLKHLNRWIGHEQAYLIGSLISVTGCVWIAIAAPTDFSHLKLFSVAILFGAGSSVTMISSLCITADMIGRHTYQGGFIYSAVTFADKFITGVVVVIIETLKCKKREDCPEYYRNVLAYGCGIAATFGLFVLFLLKCSRQNFLRRRHRSGTEE